MLNVYTKCQKYRQQAESRYRRATRGIFHGDRRYKAQGQARRQRACQHRVLGSPWLDDSAGNRCWRANWYGDLRGVVEPGLCDTATSITVRRPNLSLSRDPVYHGIYAYAHAHRRTRRARVRERVPGSAHYQTAWSSGSQGTHVKGVGAEGLQTRWSPPCRSTHGHTPVIVSFEVARRPRKRRRRRFLPSQEGSIVRWPLTSASDPTLSPNFID